MIRPVAPLFEYLINQDYISEFLCVNKENIALNCNGKCYLMQRLAQEDTQKKNNLPPIAMEEYPIGFVHLLFISAPEDIQCIRERIASYENDYTYLFETFNFHPPNSIA